VYATATVAIYEELPSLAFKVLETILLLLVVLLRMVVSIETIRKITKDKMFVVPCVKEWEAQRTEKVRCAGTGEQSV
jgi:hypothetical protein